MFMTRYISESIQSEHYSVSEWPFAFFIAHQRVLLTEFCDSDPPKNTIWQPTAKCLWFPKPTSSVSQELTA